MDDDKNSAVGSFPDPTFFTKDNKLIKDLIIYHGESTCRDYFEKNVISDLVRKCDFGFISFTKRAQIGKRKRGKNEEYSINGFILCQHEGLSPSIFISLVCISTPYKGAGAKLLSNVINYAKDAPEILQITLYSLPELRSYYEKNQFNTVSTLRLKSGEIKVYHMARIL